MADHYLTSPDRTEDGDLLVMDSVGGNHDRPNRRRLVARPSEDEIVLTEQMWNGAAWEDVGTVAVLRDEEDGPLCGYGSSGVNIRAGPQSRARD